MEEVGFSPESRERPFSVQRKLGLHAVCILCILAFSESTPLFLNNLVSKVPSSDLQSNALPTELFRPLKVPSSKKNFSQEVLQRCSQYIQHPRLELREKNCTKIEETFRRAFISKDPCNITVQDYQPLMKLVNQTIPCDKVLFWSGTKKLAQDYAKTQGNLILLTDTLVGNISDELKWCSAPGSAEVRTDSCPKRSETCPGPPTSVFWDAASKLFAENTCGKVRALLNSSIPNAFNSTSVLARVEVPNLNPSKVPKFHAMLKHIGKGQARDSCSGNSIRNLTTILEKKGIAFTCVDNSGATSAQGDLLFLSPARGGALLIALLVTLASWTQM